MDVLTALWTVFWENVPSDMCAKRRLKSACTTAQSDRSPRRPHEETSHPMLSKMRPVKILIRLHEFGSWSESSLCAYVRRYIFWHLTGRFETHALLDTWFTGRFETHALLDTWLTGRYETHALLDTWLTGRFETHALLDAWLTGRFETHALLDRD